MNGSNFSDGLCSGSSLLVWSFTGTVCTFDMAGWLLPFILIYQLLFQVVIEIAHGVSLSVVEADDHVAEHGIGDEVLGQLRYRSRFGRSLEHAQ